MKLQAQGWVKIKQLIKIDESWSPMESFTYNAGHESVITLNLYWVDYINVSKSTEVDNHIYKSEAAVFKAYCNNVWNMFELV